MEKQQTVAEAMQIINNVCASFTGNLTDHQNIQTALQTLTKALNASVDEDKLEDVAEINNRAARRAKKK